MRQGANPDMMIDRLTEDMKAALKAGDKARLGVVRMLLSELKNARIAEGGELDEAAEQRVVASYAKKRKEAMEAARDGGREDHYERERFEYEVTMSYLPKQLGEDELRGIIAKHIESAGTAGPQAFGVVMKAVMAEVGSQADGKSVSALVRQMLS
jgi:uncharacterized protein YqeY